MLLDWLSWYFWNKVGWTLIGEEKTWYPLVFFFASVNWCTRNYNPSSLDLLSSFKLRSYILWFYSNHFSRLVVMLFLEEGWMNSHRWRKNMISPCIFFASVNWWTRKYNPSSLDPLSSLNLVHTSSSFAWNEGWMNFLKWRNWQSYKTIGLRGLTGVQNMLL